MFHRAWEIGPLKGVGFDLRGLHYYVLLYTIANESIKEMSTNSQLPPSFVTPNCTSDIYYSRADERRWSDDSYSFC